jgi:hypothetical protein
MTGFHSREKLTQIDKKIIEYAKKMVLINVALTFAACVILANLTPKLKI